MIFFKKVLEIRSKQGILHFTRWAIFSCKWVSLYIHRFNQSDKDIYLHNHPWNFISVILKGSYFEESLNWSWWPLYPKPKSEFKVKKFLTVSHMNRKVFHKVNEILKGPVYSLFLAYGEYQAWYYLVDNSKVESVIYREKKNIWNRKYYI